MKIFLLILAVIAVLVLFLLLIPLRLIFTYNKDAVSNEVSITVKYLFFTFKPSKKSKEEQKKDKKKKPDKPDKSPFSFEREKARLEYYISMFDKLKHDAVKILDYAAQHAVVFEKIDVDIDFGFEDAMHTGIFTGILNGFVYSVLGFIHQRSQLKAMNVNIQPQFDTPQFNSHIECILRLKNVHIIVIVINVLKIINKLRKGRK